jgi:hypothetical protein
MSEEELRQLLREMREDPMPVDSVARVRIGVAHRVRNRRRRRVFTALALAMVPAAAWVITILPIAQPPRTRPNEVVRKSNPSVVTEQRPKQNPVSGSLNRYVRRRYALPEKVLSKSRIEREDPILIRIETPDPNILILLVEEK